MRRVVAAVLSCLAASACGTGEEPAGPETPIPEAEQKAEVVTSNGTNLNGTNLNGTNLNGTNLNGTNLNGSALASTLVAVHLSGVELGGAPLDSAWLSGGELRGSRGGLTFQGADMVGATLWGEMGDGTGVPIRVGSAAPGAGAGVWRYGFEYQRVDGTWQAVCATGDAVIVSGRWNYEEGVAGGGAFTSDPAVFTVGCAGAAVEKCVGLGYRPWAQYGWTSGVTLHSSCVRAIRADFCGDGRSWTSNGRLINLYDDVGVQSDTRWWTSEAEWDPSGARCVTAIARNLLGITCSGLVTSLSCGAKWHFDWGTVLMTETPTGPIGISLF